jgi:peptidoglycan/xylan/chitin deacetylase (PgdA/CDA1 family)
MDQAFFERFNFGALCLWALTMLVACEEKPSATCCDDLDPNALSVAIAKYPDNKKAALSITFDDGCSSVFDKIIPMMDTYRVKGTFYIIAGHVELRNEWAKWRTVQEAGHDIGNHSLTHAHYLGSTKDNKTLRMEIDSSFRLIRDNLGKPPFSFGHPFHSAGPQADKIVFENHYSTKISPAGFSKLVSLYDLSICKAEIRTALKKGEWIVTTAHGVDDKFCYNSLTSEFFANFLEYITTHSDSIHVDTFENLSKYKIEASNTKLHIEKIDNQYVVTLKSSLPSHVFNYPLTVTIDGLKNAIDRILPNHHEMEVFPFENGARVKIAPNASFIILPE